MSKVDKIELLIFGYISSIQSLLDNEEIIPYDIYQLCLLFYKNNNVSILWSKTIGNKFEMGIFDVNERESTTINTAKLSKMNHIHPPSNICHFTNYSFKNEILNGIFTLIQTWLATPFLYLCL